MGEPAQWHRELRGVESIGADETHWGCGLKADTFLTVIYQIDAGCRRLLVGGMLTFTSYPAAGLRSSKDCVLCAATCGSPYLQIIAARLVRRCMCWIVFISLAVCWRAAVAC
jgi:hypothetical protein